MKNEKINNWDKLATEAADRWERLTPDDIKEIGGNRATLISKIQEQYGHMKNQAQLEVQEFEKSHTDS